MSESFNGWANRETWSLMLWVNNDEGLFVSAREAIAGALDLESWRQADAMKDWAHGLFTRAGYVWEHGDTWPDALADIACEIGSLDRVDWAECVESMRDSLASV